jgi:DNA-binding beta-propeller fold protein YncE
MKPIFALRSRCTLWPLALVVVLASLTSLAEDVPFPAPVGESSCVWEAERAVQKGEWRVMAHPWASGEAYVRSQPSTSPQRLDFPFELEEDACLTVRPVWWRHGERKAARRFPFPLASEVGPSALAACNGRIFFLCPRSGRIGVLDPATERVTGEIDIGGYPIDLLASPDRRHLTVADAAGNRLVTIDTMSLTIVSELATPACPWAMARRGTRLYTACRGAACVIVTDEPATQIVRRLETGSAPAAVAVSTGDAPRLVVQLAPRTFDLSDHSEVSPKRLSYTFRSRAVYDAAGPWYRVARFSSPNPRELVVDVRADMKDKDIPKPWRMRSRERWTVDVSAVTVLGAQTPELAAPMSVQPGVLAMDAFPRMQERRTPTGARMACPGEQVLMVAAGPSGRVGWFALDKPGEVRSVLVGGYIADIVIDQDSGRAYASDASGNRVVVLDAKDGHMVGEIPILGMPWSLDVADGTLMVGCRTDRALAVVDTVTQRVLQRTPLGAEPLVVRVQEEGMIRSPNISRPECLAVQLQAIAFDLETGDRCELPARIPRAETRAQEDVLCAVADDPVPARPELPTDADVLAELGPWKSAADAMGAGNVQRNVGTVVDGDFGHTLALNGRNALIDFGTDPGLTGEKPFTIEAWVSWSGAGSSNPSRGDDPMSAIVGNRGLNAGCMLMVQHNGRALFNLNGLRQGQDADLVTVTSSRSVARGSWAHVVGVYDPEEGRIAVHVNGVGVSRNITAGMHASSSRWALGAQRADGPYYWFHGGIAAVRFFKGAMTAEHVRQRYEREAPYRTKTFQAEGALTLRVNGARRLDVSAVADGQRKAVRSLGPSDRPGTVSYTLDAGPPYDWMNGIWLTPDEGQFLVNGSDEFWAWNAPSFRLPAGRHVLSVRAHSAHAALDALDVSVRAVSDLELSVEPVPGDNASVFAHDEPVRFRATIAGLAPQAPGKLVVRVANYMGAVVVEESHAVSGGGDGKAEVALAFRLSGTGRFRLMTCLLEGGQQREFAKAFLRLPKLEHPRLLFRRSDRAAIRKRMQEHPLVFSRFESYLRRHCREPDFLPRGLTFKEKVQERTYLLAWRALACQFAAVFFEKPGDTTFEDAVAHLLTFTPAYYDMFHFHQALFPGAAAALFDMAAGQSEENQDRLRALFEPRRGNFNVLPQALAAIEEPLDKRDRALFSRSLSWMNNLERYFGAHAGVRGGNWWVSAWTGCHCPLNGPGFGLLYLRQALGEDALFEKTCFRGFYTHTRYLSPCLLQAWGGRCCGGPAGFPSDRSLPGPQGTPGKWILSALGRHPLMLRESGWLERFERLSAPVEHFPEAGIDQLLGHSVSVVMPLALALGWFDPEAATVRRDELPPTIVFEGEGNVVMRAGEGKSETTVFFTSGVRDVVYRDQPNHFQIFRGTEPLIGTGSLWADDVNSVPAWGNVVVVGEAWQPHWRMNVGVDHMRADERRVINRYVPEFPEYATRDERLWGVRPPHGGFSFRNRWSPLGFHQHQDDVFLQEGSLVAFETSPEFDYAAGDATNAWPVDVVDEVYRQLFFVKPHTVVIYDRVKTPVDGGNTRWMAATLPDVVVDGRAFTVGGKTGGVAGRVLLPQEPTVRSVEARSSLLYRGLFNGPRQRVLEIEGMQVDGVVEFLVVMRVGAKGAVSPVPAELTVNEAQLGLSWQDEGRSVTLDLLRTGPVGGRARFQEGGAAIDRPLVQRIDDSYRHWREDPRYRSWVSDERFAFMNLRP